MKGEVADGILSQIDPMLHRPALDQAKLILRDSDEIHVALFVVDGRVEVSVDHARVDDRVVDVFLNLLWSHTRVSLQIHFEL